MTRLEIQAIELGNNRKALRKRLNEAKSVLSNEFRKDFKTATFDFDSKRLIGDRFMLVWKIRKYPAKPISSTNQQTSCGTVHCYDK